MPKNKSSIDIDSLPLSERIAERDRHIDSRLKEQSKIFLEYRSTIVPTMPVALKAERKISQTAGVVSTWQTPPAPQGNYERVAREGYGSNEVIYACIEELCTSAAEPTLYVMNGKERIDDHPLLDLLKKPNPFLNGYDYLASLIMYRSIAGNAYTEKVYNNIGKLAELWLIRPDRMTVLPDSTNMIGGYRFRLGQMIYDYEVNEIGHYKIRNPLDSRYGLAPMSVILGRTDTDNFAREFTKAFFFNAGVPSTLLAFKTLLDEQDRAMINNRFRRDYSGSAGWHNVMVTEQNEVDVKQLGMPMGARGIAYPDLDEIMEARLAMVFGVPLTLIGARLGQKSSSYANRLSDREMFWNETLVPIYREIEANFNTWLVPEYDDITSIHFDLTSIAAFADDTDVLHARWRNNATSGLAGWRESRRKIGLIEDPADDDIIIIPSNFTTVTFKEFKQGQGFAHPPVLGGVGGQGDSLNGNGVHAKPNTTPVSRPSVPNRNGTHA